MQDEVMQCKKVISHVKKNKQKAIIAQQQAIELNRSMMAQMLDRLEQLQTLTALNESLQEELIATKARVDQQAVSR